MIAQIPDFYEDELVYSLLARYAVRSGLYSYRNAQEEIYEITTRPTFEYVNKLKQELIKRLGGIENIILHHTMFGIYARFVPEAKRRIALEKLSAGSPDYSDYLWHPQNRIKDDKYARYCPMCAKEERKQYGEAYWHRKHQIYGSNVCSKHKCYLLNSKLKIHSKETPSLLPAEFMIPQEDDIVTCINKHELATSRFMDELIDQPFKEEHFNSILKRKLQGTRYISARGGRISVQCLFDDLQHFYADYDQLVLSESWQLSKLFEGKYNNPLAIVMLAIFFEVKPGELCYGDSSCVDKTKQYDNQIHFLHQQGYNYRQITEMIGGSYDYVKAIGNQRRGGTKKPKEWNPSSGMKQKKYDEMDREYYPAVKEFVDKIYANLDERPKKLSISMVEKEFGLTSRTIMKMRCSYQYVKSHMESQEEFWVRELIWLYNRLISNDIALNKKNLAARDLHIRSSNLARIIPYLNQNDPVQKCIREILK